MKVYGSPVAEPEIDYKQPFSEWEKADEAYIEANRAWLSDNGHTHVLAGEIVRFPVADGCAQYMIVDGRSMIHLAVGDNWQIPEAHSRGLRLADIKQIIDSRKRMAELFGAPLAIKGE